MRIISKYRKLNRHKLHAKLKTASHRFALMVDNYSPDDTEAENGLLMVTGKVFVPGYTDATVTIVYPKRKRSTDQSFYYITPTESTEDMSLAYSDDTFYPRFSDCEQAVKDLPEVTVSQYFYDKGIIPDDPSTFTALTGIPLESSLVEDINQITGEDDAYYPPSDSNLQSLISQGVLTADDPTIPYYYLASDITTTMEESIAASNIFTDSTIVASQMMIILKRSDQHVEYNTSESTGDENGWDLVITSSFAPDTIQTLSWDSFESMDNDLQSDRFLTIIRRECRRYGAIYCSEISYQTWVEQYNNNFLTLASHEADLALDDNFDEQYNNDDPWEIQRNNDRTLQYFISSCRALGIDREANLIFVTKEGEDYCELVCDHIQNENGKPNSPLFTIESLTLRSSRPTPIVACLYHDTRTNSMYYLPLPASLSSTLGMTTNFIQQLNSIQSAAHDLDTCISTLIESDSQEPEEEPRPSFADSSWTQSASDPNLWISPLYTAPEEPSCAYQLVWEASTGQQSGNGKNGGNGGYALPYDIFYHTLNGGALKGFMERTSYVLGGPDNSGDWESLSKPMRRMLLYLNTIDRIGNSSPVLSLEEQLNLLTTYKRPFLPDTYNPLPDYWMLLTGTETPRSLDTLIMDQRLTQNIKLGDHYVTLVWDPQATGYETPLSVQSSDDSIASILRSLPWDLVFQDTPYSQQPEYISQIASIFDYVNFLNVEDTIVNNLTRLLNQTLELPDNESNISWLEKQETYMDALSSFSKINEGSGDQIIYDHVFPEEQLHNAIDWYLKSITLRLIFDGSRQEVTPQLICIASYDEEVIVTLQNTNLNNVCNGLIRGGILSGFTNENTAHVFEVAISSKISNFLALAAKDQEELKPLQKENALIQFSKSLEAKESIYWTDLLIGFGSAATNIFWYCKQYANDPYAGSALSESVNSFADQLQDDGYIPAPHSRTLVGNIKNKYYIPVVSDNKNMLTGYIEIQFSAAKNEVPAYVDDTSIHFMTGNTFTSEEGGELVTFGDAERPGFVINGALKNANNLFIDLSPAFSDFAPQPIHLLEEVKDEYDEYCENNQLYSQEYMDQYYSEGLLAHHIIRR